MIEFIVLLLSIVLVVVVVRLVAGREPGEFIKRTNLLGKLILIFMILWWVWILTDLPEAGSYRENIRNGRGLCNISFISKGNQSCYYSQDKLQRVIEVFNDEVLSIVVFLGLVAIVGMKRGKKV